MDNAIVEMLKDDKNSDNGRVLISSLISMLRTGKGGVLNSRELRLLLADRFENALNAKADEVSGALCITRGNNSSKYGNARYDFMLWYFEFLDEGKKPTGSEIDAWVVSKAELNEVDNNTLNKWVRLAKDYYEPVMRGTALISGK